MREPTRLELARYEQDTADHINKVQNLLGAVTRDLTRRARVHDASKYTPEERDIYAVVVPQFTGKTYGTPEHKEVGDLLGPAWEHHLAHNDHHPGHHQGGVDDMDLMMVTEMLCDWKAASLRDPNQDFSETCRLNCVKYGISPQMTGILMNTAKALNML